MTRALLLVLCIELLVEDSLACHRRYLSDVIVTHLDNERPLTCQVQGQHCKYDRNCCEGLECKMKVNGNGISTRCSYRMVYEDYKEDTVGPTWKDYQEMESSEEDNVRKQNLGALEKRNAELRRKLEELNVLRKSISRQQLLDMKQKLEETEIQELKNEKLNYEKELNLEMKRIKEADLENKLVSLEKKEVNSIMSKQQRISDLYKNMLNQLAEKKV